MNGQYDSIIRRYSSPPTIMTSDQFFNLIKAVITNESSWSPNVVSDAGAIGLMQIMPFHVSDSNTLFIPETNIRVGTTLLRDLINRFGLKEGLAAYNAGPGKRFVQVAQNYADKVIRTFQSLASVPTFSPVAAGLGPGGLFYAGAPIDVNILIQEAMRQPAPIEPYNTLAPTAGISPYQSFAPQQFEQPRQAPIQEDIYIPLAILGLLLLVAIQ